MRLASSLFDHPLKRNSETFLFKSKRKNLSAERKVKECVANRLIVGFCEFVIHVWWSPIIKNQGDYDWWRKTVLLLTPWKRASLRKVLIIIKRLRSMQEKQWQKCKPLFLEPRVEKMTRLSVWFSNWQVVDTLQIRGLCGRSEPRLFWKEFLFYIILRA